MNPSFVAVHIAERLPAGRGPLKSDQWKFSGLLCGTFNGPGLREVIRKIFRGQASMRNPCGTQATDHGGSQKRKLNTKKSNRKD